MHLLGAGLLASRTGIGDGVFVPGRRMVGVVSTSSIGDVLVIRFRSGADDPAADMQVHGIPAICPCPGKNVSPELAWHNAPAGTRSFAILMYDVDGQYGAGVSHWVAYNLAPSRTELERRARPRRGPALPAARGHGEMRTISDPVRRRGTDPTIT